MILSDFIYKNKIFIEIKDKNYIFKNKIKYILI